MLPSIGLVLAFSLLQFTIALPSVDQVNTFNVLRDLFTDRKSPESSVWPIAGALVTLSKDTHMCYSLRNNTDE